jgi:hypothetical protein
MPSRTSLMILDDRRMALSLAETALAGILCSNPATTNGRWTKPIRFLFLSSTIPISKSTFCCCSQASPPPFFPLRRPRPRTLLKLTPFSRVPHRYLSSSGIIMLDDRVTLKRSLPIHIIKLPLPLHALIPSPSSLLLSLSPNSIPQPSRQPTLNNLLHARSFLDADSRDDSHVQAAFLEFVEDP